jgi:hypothetical protein
MLRRDHELGLDGSWCDNPGATSAGPSPLCREINEELARVRLDNPEYLFFGSVAFKTHDPEPNPAQAAVVAMNLGWIATTSGTATGVAPPAEKLEDMKMAVAANDLAVASGITPDNAAELAPHVDWILVATGISETFYTFSPALCKSLRAATLGLNRLSRASRYPCGFRKTAPRSRAARDGDAMKSTRRDRKAPPPERLDG